MTKVDFDDQKEFNAKAYFETYSFHLVALNEPDASERTSYFRDKTPSFILKNEEDEKFFGEVIGTGTLLDVIPLEDMVKFNGLVSAAIDFGNFAFSYEGEPLELFWSRPDTYVAELSGVTAAFTVVPDGIRPFIEFLYDDIENDIFGDSRSDASPIGSIVESTSIPVNGYVGRRFNDNIFDFYTDVDVISFDLPTDTRLRIDAETALPSAFSLHRIDRTTADISSARLVFQEDTSPQDNKDVLDMAVDLASGFYFLTIEDDSADRGGHQYSFDLTFDVAAPGAPPSDGGDEPATPANIAPIANDNVLSTTAGQAVAASVDTLLSNDNDANSDKLAVAEAFDALNGRVAISGDTVTFTPDRGFSGVASYQYRATDGRGGEDTATVSVLVNAPETESPSVPAPDIGGDLTPVDTVVSRGTSLNVFDLFRVDGGSLADYDEYWIVLESNGPEDGRLVDRNGTPVGRDQGNGEIHAYVMSQGGQAQLADLKARYPAWETYGTDGVPRLPNDLYVEVGDSNLAYRVIPLRFEEGPEVSLRTLYNNETRTYIEVEQEAPAPPTLALRSLSFDTASGLLSADLDVTDREGRGVLIELQLSGAEGISEITIDGQDVDVGDTILVSPNALRNGIEVRGVDGGDMMYFRMRANDGQSTSNWAGATNNTPSTGEEFDPSLYIQEAEDGSGSGTSGEFDPTQYADLVDNDGGSGSNGREEFDPSLYIQEAEDGSGSGTSGEFDPTQYADLVDNDGGSGSNGREEF
ncbi:MAG: cadherin-like domain-containing protein, partial [Rhodobacteraceae bacterium]|nr:cadherin-like domain-containing protein [Paracoccaceae bacterium]